MSDYMPPIPPPSTQRYRPAQFERSPRQTANHPDRDSRSDWEILNRSTPNQIDRLLAAHYPDREIHYAKQLLLHYQSVYLPTLLQLRAQGYRGCPSPTPTQLQQIADQLSAPDRCASGASSDPTSDLTSDPTYCQASSQQVLFALQALAQRLRNPGYSARSEVGTLV
ncbi:MAG: hypothetical protein MUF72_19150 [Elainella sp. Prado103]|jgi:hypothetical protein|nr:hypothetical protein [Elainella sp. Prado103]